MHIICFFWSNKSSLGNKYKYTNQVQQVYGILSRIFDGGTSLSVEGRVRPTGRSWQRAGACQLTPCDSCDHAVVEYHTCDMTSQSSCALDLIQLAACDTLSCFVYCGRYLFNTLVKFFLFFCQDSIACIDHSNRHSPWNHRSVFLVNDKVDVLLTETKRKTKSYKNKKRKYKN